MANNPLSSLSYTNKDFNSIYVELLDIVKELSAKWDPTISNESDPGVILLKADAIIADKNNYNIDKNVLEMYPETVTQEVNARNLYKQLAYRMPWYQSATTTVTFRWVGRELVTGETVEIPRYSMLTNDDGTVVYTLTEEVILDVDHLIATASVIEGTFQTLSINGSTIINLGNLDSNNRVYFPDSTVAENGLFIKTVDGLHLWERVDNLQVHPKGSTYFEFGVDSRNSTCYIEFPEDIDRLIGNGLLIQYVVSQGSEGNVAATAIDRFYSDLSVNVGSDSIVLNNDTVLLYNPSASVDGKDPQTLTEAYRSYRKIAGTFDTLVTLRDYVNAIYNSGLVSNAIVSDRLNDIQCAYTIRTEDLVNPFIVQKSRLDSSIISYYEDDVHTVDDNWFRYNTSTHTMEAVSSSDVESAVATNSTNPLTKIRLYRMYDAELDDMTAFDLKLYLLHNAGIITSNEAYESTFDLEMPDSVEEVAVKTFIYDQHCIQHDFTRILENLPCLFKNTFPIGIKIVPQHYLTPVQIDQVKRNIIAELWKVCNANAVDFGDEPSYDVIYDTILNADERIKLIILDEFNYTTFATYWDGTEFKDIPISDSKSQFVIECSASALNSYKSFNPEWTKTSLMNAYFICNDNDENNGNIYKYDVNTNDFSLYSTLRKDIQAQIIAKSVLAGRTPLIKDDSRFSYNVNHKYEDEIDTDRITTALVVSPFSTNTSTWNSTTFNSNGSPVSIPIPSVDFTNNYTGDYALKANESVRFLAPSLESLMSYSNYVKFQLVLNNQTGKAHNAVHWSESVQNGDIYQVDKSDYNNTVFDYISKDLLIPVKCSVHNGEEECYHLYIDKGSLYITATDSGDLVAQPLPVDSNDDNARWLIESNPTPSGGTLIYNLGLNKYLTVTTTSTSNYSTEETVSGDTTFYTHSVSSTSEQAVLKLEESVSKNVETTPGQGVVHYYWTDSQTYVDGVFTYIHKEQRWNKKQLYLVDFDEFNDISSVMKADSCISLTTTANKKFAKEALNVTYSEPQTEDDTEQLTFTAEDSYIYVGTIDDVTHIDLSKIYIYSDKPVGYNGLDYVSYRTVYDQLEGPPTADDIIVDSTSMKGLYDGTHKWLNVQYQKDKIMLDDTPRDNILYKGTDAIIHKAWKAGTLTLYKEETLYRIAANCDYQLQEGDSIIFFWRTDDSIEDSPYEYKKYVGFDSSSASATEQSPIIRPSFVLNGCSASDAAINPDSLNNTGIIEYGDTAYKDIYAMYGDNDLSGSKSIEIRGLKQTILDRSKNNYYFITNSISSDGANYEMPLYSISTEGTSKSFKYILQADEYFIITNKTYTEYLICNPGTLIGLELDNSQVQSDEYLLEVTRVPYEDIASIGIDAFSDYCKTIPADCKLYTQEQQVHNVVEGNILMMKRLYETTTLPPIVSWEDTVIPSDIEVSYKTVSGEIIKLPAIELQSSTYSWTARSYLNLNTSTQEPQIIEPIDQNDRKAARMIVFPQGDTNKVFPKFTFDEGVLKDSDTLSDLYVQSDVFVNKVGGPNIDVSYVNLFADRESPTFYLYSIDDSFSSGKWSIRADDGKIMLRPQTEGNIAFSLQLTSGCQYMLPLQLITNNNVSIQLKYADNTDVESFNGEVSKSSHMIYYTFTTEESDVELVLSVAGSVTNDDCVVFDSLIRFVPNNLFASKYGITYDQLKLKVRTLDIDNVYKYSHIVNSNDEYYIEDPLEGKSFFNQRHIMNPYTIGKAELQLGNSSDAYIMITNNR